MGKNHPALIQNTQCWKYSVADGQSTCGEKKNGCFGSITRHQNIVIERSAYLSYSKGGITRKQISVMGHRSRLSRE